MGRSVRVTTAAVALAATVVMVPAVPAAAGTASVEDVAGDSGQAIDLLGLDVRHAEPPAPRRLVLQARHAGLPSFDTGTFTTVTFWIDVRAGNRGPEYVSDVAPNVGGIRLLRVEGWGRRGKSTVRCPKLRARADVFRPQAPVLLKVPRSCLGDPARARGAVVATGETARGDLVGRDWVGSRRQWSPWVRR